MRTKASASIRSNDGAWVTLQEAAARLGVSTRTIQRHIRAGKLDARRGDDPRVRVMAPAMIAAASPVPVQDLQTLIMKVDQLSELVKTAIRLDAPKTLEALGRKWA